MKLVALLVIAVPAFAETPVVDFDQGVDAAAVVQEAKKNAVEAEGVEAEDAAKVAYRAERDCVTFVFEPDGQVHQAGRQQHRCVRAALERLREVVSA